MKGLRSRFERFCFQNRDKGIPNLMLYIVLGCGVVSAMSLLGYSQIYNVLCFDREAILQGQVWRLITYIFTMSSGNIFMTLILLYCYYSLGRALEQSWGSLRFTLYYLTGILLMDIFALLFGGIPVAISQDGIPYQILFSSYYSSSVTNYLHLSMLICFATTFPDTQFYILFFIPIKAWILALIYLGITLFEVISLTVPNFMFPHNLFPLVGLANYFLFYGKDVANILPPSWRRRSFRTPKKKPVQTGTIPFSRQASSPAYTHRCSVCSKTDVTNPELEFRYCSRCNGYFCYCQEHISNHIHIE